MRFVFSIARSKNSGMEIEIINIDLQRDDFFYKLLRIRKTTRSHVTRCMCHVGHVPDWCVNRRGERAGKHISDFPINLNYARVYNRAFHLLKQSYNNAWKRSLPGDRLFLSLSCIAPAER